MIFLPDFLSLIVKEISGYYNLLINEQWRMGGGGSTKSVLGSEKTKQTIFRHVRYLFLPFSLRHYIHLLCLILTKIAPIQSIGPVRQRR